jgi:HopA1 effector protein family
VSGYREQVAAALRAVTISGPTRYTWLGRRSRRLPAALEAALREPDRRRYLVGCLREELYCSFYCHGRPVTARWGEPQPVSPDPGLVAEMAAANAGQGRWDAGWTVERVDGDVAVVAVGGLRMRVGAHGCLGALQRGATVSVRMPKELPAFSPGFWSVEGEAPPSDADVGQVRVYWNVTRESAPALVAAVTAEFNRTGLPFRLKVADHPFRLDRCDAAVLYLDGETFSRARGRIDEMATALATRLRPAIPAFTYAFRAGVGLAEDEDGESFGVRRCALLADGIVRAHEQGLTAIGDRLDAVARRFAEDGVDIDAPFRAPSLAGRHVV